MINGKAKHKVFAVLCNFGSDFTSAINGSRRISFFVGL